MFRFTIRDVLWLTALAAVLVTWWLSNSRQNSRIQTLSARIQTLEALVDLSDVEFRKMYPTGWEGLTQALRGERSVLKFRVSSLKYELEKRGHRVIIAQDQVLVDPSEDLLRSFGDTLEPAHLP
jgi:hypothetical protein